MTPEQALLATTPGPEITTTPAVTVKTNRIDIGKHICCAYIPYLLISILKSTPTSNAGFRFSSSIISHVKYFEGCLKNRFDADAPRPDMMPYPGMYASMPKATNISASTDAGCSSSATMPPQYVDVLYLSLIFCSGAQNDLR